MSSAYSPTSTSTKKLLRHFSRDIFTVVVAIAVGILVWFSHAIFDFVSPPQENLLAPNLVGLGESDAVAASNRDHLSAVVVARRTSDRYPAGAVISQDPQPDSVVRPGRRISLIASSGLNLVSMPDLRFRSQREVNLILSRLHLRAGKIHYADSDVVDMGHVVDQDPGPLTQVRQDTSVNFGISRGQPQSVTVDNFVGLQIDDARDDAMQSKIRLGQIVWTPFGADGPPRGVVVRQRPAPGTVIDPRQMVSLQVSAGPHQFGYLVREVHAAVTIPLEAPSAALRVTAVDEMGTRPVYEGYGTGGQRLDITTTTVGPAQLNTYLNNQLIDTTVVAHEAPSQVEQGAGRGEKTTVDPHELVAKPAKSKRTVK